MVSVVFVTFNRKELLCRAVKAVLTQTMPVEIIVMDDASNDGTEAMMQTSFAGIRYFRSRHNRGPSFQRNEGAKKATSDIVVFLDDDTIIEEPHILQQTLADFSSANIGAVAIPFINILQNNKVQACAPDQKTSYFCHAFVGAAFAVRRQVFLQLGGFRQEYFYMGEEGDFCIRMLEAGYYVKAGTSSPALHYQPAGRVSFAADYFGRRNDILFVYLNVPRLYLPVYLIGSILKGLWFGVRVRRLLNMLKGTSAGLRLLFKKDVKALVKPVGIRHYRTYRYLKHNEPLSLQDLQETPDAMLL